MARREPLIGCPSWRREELANCLVKDARALGIPSIEGLRHYSPEASEERPPRSAASPAARGSEHVARRGAPLAAPLRAL